MHKMLFAILFFCLSFPVFGDDETGSITETGDLDKAQKDERGKKGKRRAHLQKMREKFDVDGDGELSQEERRRFKQAVLRFEMKRKRKKLMRELDSDGDGQLSAEQQKKLAALLEKHKQDFLQRRKRKQNGKNQRGDRFQANGENQQRFRQKMLERFDTNKDGVLSEEEKQQMPRGKRGRRGRLPGARQKMLERFDTNKDGVLSEEEKQKMREALQNRRGKRGRNFRDQEENPEK